MAVLLSSLLRILVGKMFVIHMKSIYHTLCEVKVFLTRIQARRRGVRSIGSNSVLFPFNVGVVRALICRSFLDLVYIPSLD
ncbi:hypothetical protein KC19_VG180000 [Ceratodon purpureus]|uniref:Secreted protein n=1 Tax=Ceratodon purpureus TaxID=3225 RepID=A0A8T0HSD3_CERPU|nr:hypothetical protein KC19_VG180000 [Ceratodon purpureus]